VSFGLPANMMLFLATAARLWGLTQALRMPILPLPCEGRVTVACAKVAP